MRTALAILMFISLNAFALDFKGVELGAKASPKEINEKLGVKCGNGANGLTAVCNGRVTITGSPASLNLVIGKSGEVMRISLSFSSSSYSRVASALLEKFGPATEQSNETVSNAMGAKFDQQIYTWQEGNNKARLKKYAGRITESSLYMSTEEDETLFRNALNKDKDDI